jgi:hypothetical protein
MGLGCAFETFILACKAFFKTFKQPMQARSFVEGEKKQTSALEKVADTAHLRLLSYLQLNGRLIDFLKEDLSSFDDAQVGAAVRKIHQDCAETLEDIVTIRPLRDELEGTTIQVPKGYDASEWKITGKVKGEPPFTGILVHRGWKAHKRSLPKQVGEQNPEIVCPAEIEIK